MILGKSNIVFFIILLNFFNIAFSEDKITAIPLANLENLEPSFEKEDVEDKNILKDDNIDLKEKKNHTN